ncbi:MAG: BamA/TamA family outer membrane protein [Acidisphaera sp.]|nr:BamA/TamA family outer membrane protein [Acidisphaera sp.]
MVPRALHRRLRGLAILLAAAGSLVALCALIPGVRGADPQPYTVSIAKTGNAALDAALNGSSSLISLRRSAPVGPFALIARAQDDAGRFVVVLHSFGYYKGVPHITIAGRTLDDPGLADFLDATPKATSVEVAVALELGPLFHLGKVAILGSVPPEIRNRFALAPGQPVVAAAVLAARDSLLGALQDDGYALAKVDLQPAIERPDTDTLDISVTVDAGPRVDIGAINFAGLQRVNPDYVRRRLLLHPGERYDAATIETARQDLASLGVFSSVRIEPADRVDAQGQLPLTIAFTERPRHAVSIGAAFSTDLGGSITASWTHRNLFGNGEQLTFSAAATELGGSDAKEPGYNIGATFLKPDWLHRDQSLQLNLAAIKEYLESYDRTAVVGGATVSRKVSQNLTASLGVSAEQERVIQEQVTRSYTLVGLPLGLRWDDTGSLFEPTHGFRAQATVTPTESFGGAGGSTPFVLLQLGGSAYVDMGALLFGTSGRSVLALRGLVGAAEGATQFELPPDQRFYAGGSGTIRGYRYQYVGPHFADNHPQGGTAVDAGTIEYRQRFGASFGAAVFVDAGQVSTAGPFQGALRVGAGIGARYYTSIGPIRLDFAVPLIRQPGSDAFEVYIGIGEAF